MPAGALLSLVVQILDGADSQTALAQLLSRVPSRRAGRLKTLTLHCTLHCSGAMKTAIGESMRLRRYTTGPPALLPQPPTHRGRLDPTTVPDLIPDAWAAPLHELGGPTRYLRRDAAVAALIEAKRAGKTVEKTGPAAKATGAVDLMEALRASVERARSPKVTGGKAAGPGVIAEKKPGAKKRIRSTPPTDGNGG
ncbi:hypothetical protein [Streptomyces nojiriensis]|uniref:hypothetical protein n=1 Tax=Streptomyces nojiriensis TaxID=66374 RepID=UPI0035D8EBAB